MKGLYLVGSCSAPSEQCQPLSQNPVAIWEAYHLYRRRSSRSYPASQGCYCGKPLKITCWKVHRVLINNGSSVDILFSSTLDRMNLIGHMFTLVRTPLYDFFKENVHTEGELDLPIELGDAPCQHVQSIKFLVVNYPSVYNVIIGRPTINAIHAITSTYHLLVNFSTV